MRNIILRASDLTIKELKRIQNVQNKRMEEVKLLEEEKRIEGLTTWNSDLLGYYLEVERMQKEINKAYDTLNDEDFQELINEHYEWNYSAFHIEKAITTVKEKLDSTYLPSHW